MRMRDIITLVEQPNKRVMMQIGGKTVPTVGPYPEFGTPYYLPTTAIEFYDDPYTGRGDDGYSMSELRAEVQQAGEITHTIQVGLSIREGGSKASKVYAFNGNHRLAVAKEMKLPFMQCEASDADDAEPLTIEQIVKLGGHF